MNSDVLQALRYGLQKRVRRLNSTRSEAHYVLGLRQYWHYLQSHSLLWGVLDDLRLRVPDANERIEPLFDGGGSFEPTTEEEHASLALALIERSLSDDGESPVYSVSYRLGRVDGTHVSDYVEQFHEFLTEPLYEYIDEKLDTGRAVLGLLLRYKHRCEWFSRSRLFETWQSAEKRGEKVLALDMYQYLFDQGLDFAIEPASASGEADLVEAQTGEERLVADAKIFNPDSGKDVSYLARGVNQLYIYSQDYNQPVGYLVVFKTSEADLRLALSDTVSGIPVLSHNNKSLFILVIDIFPHSTTASKRGRLKVREVTEADFLELVT